MYKNRISKDGHSLIYYIQSDDNNGRSEDFYVFIEKLINDVDFKIYCADKNKEIVIDEFKKYCKDGDVEKQKYQIYGICI